MINKNIFLSICAMVLIMTQFSCVDDVPVSEVTNVPFDVETISTPNIVSSEANTTYTVDFVLDDGQIVDTQIDITLDEASTTATNGVDFNFTPTTVSIPAYVRNGSFSFDVLADLEAEGDETVKFIIGPHDAPFSIGSEHEVNVTIEDSIYTTLDLVVAWDGTFDYNGSPYPICGNVDMDVYFTDVEGNFLGLYPGATAACPEVITIDDTYADGTYILLSQFYENGLDGLGLNVPFPITVTATKGGVFTETFVPVDIWTSEDEAATVNSNYNFKFLFELTIAGDTYTIKDEGGQVIVQGFRPKIVQ